MSRETRMLLTILGAVAILGALLRVSIPPAGYEEREGAVTMAAPHPTPTPCFVDSAPARPMRPATQKAVATLRAVPTPLTFAGPEGVIVAPLSTNWDAVDAHCARKLLALVSREGAPGWMQYRDARHGAVWRACPEMRR